MLGPPCVRVAMALDVHFHPFAALVASATFSKIVPDELQSSRDSPYSVQRHSKMFDGV